MISWFIILKKRAIDTRFFLHNNHFKSSVKPKRYILIRYIWLTLLYPKICKLNLLFKETVHMVRILEKYQWLCLKMHYEFGLFVGKFWLIDMFLYAFDFLKILVFYFALYINTSKVITILVSLIRMTSLNYKVRYVHCKNP